MKRFYKTFSIVLSIYISFTCCINQILAYDTNNEQYFISNDYTYYIDDNTKVIDIDYFINEEITEHEYSTYGLINSIENITKKYTTPNWSIMLQNDTLAPNGGSSMTMSYTHTTTVENSYGISAKEINVKLGFSSSSEISLSKSLSYTCPITDDGRSVASCTYQVYPNITRYTYDVYYLGVKIGTGNADVFTGFRQHVVIHYK